MRIYCPHPHMFDPVQKYTRALVPVGNNNNGRGVHKVGDEGISEAVEAGEMVMQVRKQ